jgi:hypothetical protein
MKSRPHFLIWSGNSVEFFLFRTPLALLKSLTRPVAQMRRGTGFQPVGLAGVPPASRDPAGRMPAGPTAKMAVLQPPYESRGLAQWLRHVKSLNGDTGYRCPKANAASGSCRTPR